MKKSILLSVVILALATGNLAAQITGATISGTAIVGAQLTAGYTGTPSGGNTISYAWFDSDNNSLGVTTSTYTIPASLQGKMIYVKVSEYDAVPALVAGPFTSPNSSAVNYFPVATIPVVSGTVNVTEILTASYTYSDNESDPESGSKYRWYRSNTGVMPDTVFITGATNMFYKLTNSDYGKYIAFSVKPISSAGSKTGLMKVSAFTTAVTNSAPVATAPVLSGTERVGEVLTATYSYSDAEGDLQGASKYQWYRTTTGSINDTVKIVGATNIFYKLTNSEYPYKVAFAVIPYAQTGNLRGARVSSGLSGTIANNAPVASSVTITTPGTLNVNDVLLGSYIYSDTEGDQESGSVYQWLRSPDNNISNGTVISLATALTYKLTEADTGKYIFFRVTPKASTGNITGTQAASAGVGSVNTPPYAINVDIAGLVQVGQTLTGTYSYGDRDDDLENPGGSIYQWYRGGTAIPGATSVSYIVVEDDEDEYLKFEVTPVSATGFPVTGLPVSYTYPSKVPVTSTLPVADQLCIDGIRKKDNTITGKYHYSGTSNDTKFQFRWMRDADTIPGATSKTYKLTDSDISRDIFFVVYPISKTGLRRGITAKSGSLARIKMEKSSFYSTEKDTVLSGEPAGGTFYGDGVSTVAGVSKFSPSSLDPTGGPYKINYQILITNSSTTCQQTHPKDITVTGVTIYFEGLNSNYCNNGELDTIYARNIPASALPGTYLFYMTGPNAIKYQLGNMVVLDPKLMREGYNIDYLVFECRDIFFLPIVHYEPLIVYSAPKVAVEGLRENQVFCSADPEYRLSPVPSGGVFTGKPIKNTDYFDPGLGNVLDTVKYTYTQPSTGCISERVYPVVINKSPKVYFDIADNCIENQTDFTQFTNATRDSTQDVIKSWKWEFFESGSSTTDTTETPSHLYKIGGNYVVNLTATTINNCALTATKNIDLGNKPVADFYWLSECLDLVVNKDLLLFDHSTSLSSVDSTIWIFPDGTSERYDGLFTDTTRFRKTISGPFDIKYIVKTNYNNCNDEKTRTVFIRPTITIPQDGYLQNFEAGKDGWEAYDPANKIWSFGTPTGRTIINKAASGTKAWYTSYLLTNQVKDSASVISPCFDFSTVQRPMIKMMMWKRFDRDRDGATLQYKIGDEPGWNYVGTFEDGINWFNSALIKGKPGDGTLGWTAGSGNSKDSYYVESSNKLDLLTGKKDVKFRISYGSDGTSTNNDGIAFDSIWIGSRTRGVLIEHFTNNSSSASIIPTNTISDLSKRWSSDVINIQYHTNFPGADPYYDSNPADAGARFLFYGLTSVPYTFIDGGTDIPNYASVFDYGSLAYDSAMINKRSMVNPFFRIDLTATISKTGGSDILSVSGKIKALRSVNAENLTLYIAVTQKEGSKDGKTYYNLFRKFIPDGGGISMPRNMALNDEFNLAEKTWTVSNFDNNADMEVIVFVQNNITKQVYQAESMEKLDITVGIDDRIREAGTLFRIWPNPASHRITIDFSKPLASETDIVVYDFSGVPVRSFKAAPGETELVVEDISLKAGIYFVRLMSGGIELGHSKLVVSGK